MADRSGWSLRCGLAAATLLAGVLASAPPAPAAPAPPYVTDPATLVNDPTTDGSVDDAQGETASAVSGDHVVVAYTRVVGPANDVGWAVSTDGGRSFTDRGTLPAGPGGNRGDVAMASDATTGRVYLANAEDSLRGIAVHRSDDAGLSFGAPVDAAAGVQGYKVRPAIAVDDFPGPCGGNVYVGMHHYAAGVSNYLVTRSGDGGSTWGPPGGTLAGYTREASLAVTPDHHVHAFWYRDRSPGQGTVVSATSTDCGATFGPPRHVAPSPPESGDLVDVWWGAEPRVAVSRVTGAIVVAYWYDPPTARDGDVYAVVSRDGGATWSEPDRLSAAGDTVLRTLPAVAFAPDGRRTMVSWYEDGLDQGAVLRRRVGRLGTVGTGGTRWGEQFLLSEAFPLVDATSFQSYESIAALDGAFVATWTDNRDGNAAHARQPDVRFARVPVGGPATDLSIALTGPPGPVAQGEATTVTAVVTNEGTAAGDVVFAAVVLPPALRTTAASVRTGHCGGTRVVVCRLGRVPAGRSVTVTLTAVGVLPGTGTATAAVTGASRDVDPADDTATAPVSTDPGTTGAASVVAEPGAPVENFETVEVPLDVAAGGWVVDADVSLRIRHSYPSNLEVLLESPEGTVVVLADHAGSGGSGGYGSGGTGCSGTPATFDDDAAAAIGDEVSPFVGSFRPDQPLAGVDGTLAAGTWRLRVTDTAPLDTGVLDCVRLDLVTTP